MTREQFDKWLDEQPLDDKLVRIRYKYSGEDRWTYENEVLMFNGDQNRYEWLDDWDEGQEDVEILGCVSIEKIEIPAFEEKGRKFDCTDCVLDETDACPRGAGRAVDSEVCEEFLKEGEKE